jgi:hypothetical protein
MRNVRDTGPGKFTNFEQPIEGAFGRIYNFDIDGHELKLAHKEWLRRHILPYLAKSGSATLEALTSTTGSLSHNRQLSEDRLREIVKFLTEESPQLWNLRSSIANGEAKARLFGERDGHENEFWRGVDITAWSRPTPPPTRDAPPKETTLANRITKRFFESLSTTKGDGHGGPPDDALTQLIKSILDALINGGKLAISNDEEGEKKEKRERTKLPVEWEVTRVHIEEHYATIMSAMDSESVHRTKQVTYTWGESTPAVFVEHHFKWQVWIAGGSKPSQQGERTDHKVVARDEARKSTFYTPRD